MEAKEKQEIKLTPESPDTLKDRAEIVPDKDTINAKGLIDEGAAYKKPVEEPENKTESAKEEKLIEEEKDRSRKEAAESEAKTDEKKPDEEHKAGLSQKEIDMQLKLAAAIAGVSKENIKYIARLADKPDEALYDEYAAQKYAQNEIEKLQKAFPDMFKKTGTGAALDMGRNTRSEEQNIRETFRNSL